jgi:hypothetical protein
MLQQQAHSELDHQGTKWRVGLIARLDIWKASDTVPHQAYRAATKRLAFPTVQQETISNSYNNLLTDVENM